MHNWLPKAWYYILNRHRHIRKEKMLIILDPTALRRRGRNPKSVAAAQTMTEIKLRGWTESRFFGTEWRLVSVARVRSPE